MDPDDYCDRIGVEFGRLDADYESLATLQRAHTLSVPFETLSITGHPHADVDGEGVDLALDALYDKVVERRRGGFCYELNELFRWLLAEVGFAVERRSARVVSDGEPGLPADHLALVVTLDQPYLVDVGTGTPRPQGPIPLAGDRVTDAGGIDWRVVACDRPDLDLALQYRQDGAPADGDGWTDRYYFRNVPRPLSFFHATCEYHQTAPETPFTGDPFVIQETESGYRRLDPTTLTTVVDGEETEQAVAPAEWDAVLEREFGFSYPTRRA
ncbi:arylamine N-acetyltransferase family protein [Halobacteriales archaeon Cl-PHB]